MSLWFRGNPDNAPESMYVILTDANGLPGTVHYDDPNAPRIEDWTQWNIPLREFGNRGVVLTEVETVSIGLGDRNGPVLGNSGDMFFDDIRLYLP